MAIIGFKQTDGGRVSYFDKKAKGDCATRAIAISNNMDYLEAHNLVRSFKKGNPDTGLNLRILHKIMESLGWVWISTNKKRLSEISLPKEDIVLIRLAHAIAIKDGLAHDTFISLKTRGIKIHGYYRKEIACLFDENYF